MSHLSHDSVTIVNTSTGAFPNSDYYGWQTVDSSTSNTSSKSINYNGSLGYYIRDINAYSGSGNHTFCQQYP